VPWRTRRGDCRGQGSDPGRNVRDLDSLSAVLIIPSYADQADTYCTRRLWMRVFMSCSIPTSLNNIQKPLCIFHHGWNILSSIAANTTPETGSLTSFSVSGHQVISGPSALAVHCSKFHRNPTLRYRDHRFVWFGIVRVAKLDDPEVHFGRANHFGS
jgi:hypothetical protein